MKKGICIIFSLIFMLLGLSSCRGKMSDEELSAKPANYSFEAQLRIAGKVVDRDDVIDVDKDQLNGTVVVNNKNQHNTMRMLIFSDGMPVEFEVGKNSYTSYLFEAKKDTKIKFTVNSAELVAQTGTFDIVFVLEESISLLYSRDDEKNYTFAMNYLVNNTSEQSRMDMVDHVVETVDCTYDDYFESCYNGQLQNNATNKQHDYDYDKKVFGNLISNEDLDICFTNTIDGAVPTNMSVKRNVVKNITNDGKLQLRVCGKPGEYILTMFDRGEKYAGFNGLDSVKISIKENCFSYIEVDYPPYLNQEMSCIYGIAVECGDNTSHEVYDSGILNVYFSDVDIDLSSNQVERMVSVYHQNELVNPNIEDQIFDYNGGNIQFNYVFCERVSSIINRYWLIVMIDGILQEYGINYGEPVYMYELHSTGVAEELLVDISPTLLNTDRESFTVSFVIVPATIGSPLTSTSSLGLDMCMSCDVRFTNHNSLTDDLSDVSLDGEDYSVAIVDADGKQDRFDDVIGIQDVSIDLKVTSTQNCAGISYILVNGQNIKHDEKAFLSWSVSSDHALTEKYMIPEEYLSYGLNEVYIISTTGERHILARMNIYVYPNSSEIQFVSSISESSGVVTIDLENLDSNASTRLFCSSSTRYGYFSSLFSYITIRHSAVIHSDRYTYSFGEENGDQRVLLTMIIASKSYSDGTYSFEREKRINTIL